MTVVDLTTAGASGTINGALFSQGAIIPGGTGVLEPFIRLRHSGTEYGYNTSARPYTDTVLLNGGVDTNAGFNRALPLNTVPLVSLNGEIYLDFTQDLDQTSSRSLISLDESQISLSTSPTLQNDTPDGTYNGAASLIYDMGGSSTTWVKMNADLAPGSSGADVHMDIPLSDLPDSAFSGPNRSLPLRSDEYVYLYSHFGSQNLNSGDTTGSANGGYEEWSAPALGSVTPAVGTSIFNANTGQLVVNPAMAGLSVKDSAAVTGTNGTATGTVTFLFYANSNGTGTPIAAGTVPLNASGVANYSAIQGPLHAGSYSFVAHYNGDTHYLPGDSPVEPLVVLPAQTALTTSQTPNSVTIGNSIPPILKDSAVLSLGYNPTGPLTFTLYAPGGAVVDTETVTVNGNGTYTTPIGYTLPTSGAVAGTYQWRATYGGDADNLGVSSVLGAEPVTVLLAAPNIGTTANPSNVTLSDTGVPVLQDSATLSGAFNPTGTITFRLYAPGGTTVVDTEVVNVTANGTYSTSTGYTLPTTGTATGTYQWLATYSGDINNSASGNEFGDEPVLVKAATPDVDTMANPSNVTLSAVAAPVLKDTAILAGGFSPTGTLTFRLHAPGGAVVDTETVPVSGNGTYTTPSGYTLPTGGTVTGTYQWVVTYDGDGNNNTSGSALGDEPVNVSLARPSVSTTASPTNVTLTAGAPPTLKDTANLSGGYHETGSLLFSLYAPGGGTTAVYTETVAVNGDGTYTTPAGYTLPTDSTVVGTYQWLVTYSGDGNNGAASNDLGDEPVSVTKATIHIDTTPNPGDVALSNVLPPALKDSATLTGGYHETGSILFTLYGPDGTSVVATDSVPINGDGTYTTPNGYVLPTGGPLVGTYQWVVSYIGDGNNGAVTTVKGDEPVDVDPAAPILVTSASPNDVTLSNGGSPTLQDSAILTGGFHETGSLVFDLYAPNGTTLLASETVPVSGDGSYSTTTGYTLPPNGGVTGTYQWVVTYNGDDNNLGATSPMGVEPVAVKRAGPGLSTLADPSNVTLSAGLPPKLTDSATLSGGYHETGTLTFTLYAPGGGIVDTETATVNGDGTYNTPTGYTLPTGTTVTGTYQWVVGYSGDANNNAVASASGDEPVKVDAAVTAITTTTNPTQVTVGVGAFNDSASLSGGYDPGGTLTFALYDAGGVTLLYTDHVAVTGGGTYSTSGGDNPGGYVPTSAGVYQWVVTYGGDGNNAAVASGLGDERVVATTSTAFLTTTQSPSSVGLSAATPPSLADAATLTGGFNPTGTLTFTLYAPGGGVVDTEAVPVNGDGTYATPAGYTLPAGTTVTGTYQWVVGYSGDANNAPATSVLGDEPVVVKPASPSIGTTTSPSSLTLGDASPPSLKDTATLAGAFNPTGTLTFTLYAPGGGVVDTETVPVSGNGTYATPTGYTLPAGSTVTGTYQWQATYSGDGNNVGTTSVLGTEPVAVSLAGPRLETLANPSDVKLSNAVPPVLTDTATLSGGYHETGTLTFTLYAPGGAVVATETVPVSGNGTYATPTGYTLPTGSTVTGTYQWLVSYSGDGNNKTADSTLGSEPVMVRLATASVSTTANPTNVTLSSAGTPVLKDSAVLAGSYHGTGTITFQLFAPGGSVVDTETVTVNGDGTYSTPAGYTLPVAGTATGTYQWLATYSGDANNDAASNDLGDEPVAVARASLRISTTPDPGDVALDQNLPPLLKDSATLAGGYHETGSLTFTLYSPGGAVIDAETVPVSGDGTYNTPTGYTLPADSTVTGDYQWVVSYTGDINNNPATTTMGDEPVDVDPANPSLHTNPTPGSVTLSGAAPPALKDTATITGAYNPTGTLTFTLYAPNGTTVLDTESLPVVGNGTYTTPTGYALPSSGVATGTYQWVVSYSGDGNNGSVTSPTGSEPVNVIAANVRISTTADPDDVRLDNSGAPTLSDSATLAGGYHETGSILFTLYGPGGGAALYSESVAVNGDGTYATAVGYHLPTTGTVTGTYHWVAAYSGDANNATIASGPEDEPVFVDSAFPAIRTVASPAVVTLSNATPPVLIDSATLTGGYFETGTMTFTLYAPGGAVVDTETVVVNGDGTYITPIGYTLPSSGTITGTYHWVASYGGDPNNSGVSSLAADEPVLVTPAGPSLVTTAIPAFVTLSDVVPPVLTDSAILTGGYHETGTMTFTLYAPGGAVVDSETVPVNGDGTYNTPTGHTLPTGTAVTGTYQWVVSYSGDGNNRGVGSAQGDEPVTVTPSTATFGTAPVPANVILSNGTPPLLTDTATLAGAYNPTGSIVFTLYAPGGAVVDTETVPVSGNGTYTTPSGYTLPTSGAVAGTYQWIASYSGDGNNNPAASVKGDEPVSVMPAGPTITTSLDPSTITLSNAGEPTLMDSAILAGGYDEVGSILFRLYGPDGSTVVDEETVPVHGNGTYFTPAGYTLPTSGSLTGRYQWVASYSGDDNNRAVASVRGDEPVDVRQAIPSIVTATDPASVTLKSGMTARLNDSATLVGGYHGTGALTFTLYGPDGSVVDTESVPVHGDGTYATPSGYLVSGAPASTGTYQWVVGYSGDAYNAAATTVRGAEPVSVIGQPSVTIDGLRRLGVHHQPVQVILHFTGALDPATANDVSHYQLVQLSPHPGRAPRPVRLQSATYNPLAHTVTLRPVHGLNVYHHYQLTVSGVLDADGYPIVGNGGPGGSYVVRFGRESLKGIPLTHTSAVPRPSIFAFRGVSRLAHR